MIIIRSEKKEDNDIVYELNRAAFGSELESQIIDTIRKSKNFIPELSLVALDDKEIVGHILFSRAKIKTIDNEIRILVLAPMAVLPKFQNQGIGSLLVREGLKESKSLGYDIVVLIGHPNYYPRFGFTPAMERGLKSSIEVEKPEAFMICELKKDALKGIKGIVEFPPYFDE